MQVFRRSVRSNTVDFEQRITDGPSIPDKAKEALQGAQSWPPRKCRIRVSLKSAVSSKVRMRRHEWLIGLRISMPTRTQRTVV